MTLGPVMFGLEGPILTSQEQEWLQHPASGGVILFSRNYETPEQLTELTTHIRSIRDILIAVDQEGGRVQRFRQGFTSLPAAACYLDSCSNQQTAIEQAKTSAWLMASELLACGVDFSFAPVLDVDCGISEIIGDRAFSTHADQVTQLALAFRQGMVEAGMAAVGKHFPGHGGVALDSHLSLPEDTRSFDELLQRDLKPFTQLIAAGLEGIMPAHIIYPHIDSNPAGFSAIWVNKILRQQLHFDGAVFSDDLCMAGAAFAGNFTERACMALDAGDDMVLLCNQTDAVASVLEAAMPYITPTRERRLKAMRQRKNIDRSSLLNSEQWQQASKMLQLFN